VTADRHVPIAGCCVPDSNGRIAVADDRVLAADDRVLIGGDHALIACDRSPLSARRAANAKSASSFTDIAP
jgi:hypothetical protein